MKPIYIPVNNDYINGLNWVAVSNRCSDVEFMMEHLDKLDWTELSGNEHAVEILEQNTHCIDWHALSSNTNPKAMDLLEEHLDVLVTGYSTDFSKLFRNESEKAFKLTSKVLEEFKKDGKMNWVSNKDCWMCKEVAGCSKCRECNIEKWLQLATNQYAIPLLEDFIFSDGHKYYCRYFRLYDDYLHAGINFRREVALMTQLSKNKGLTQKLIDFIKEYFVLFTKKCPISLTIEARWLLSELLYFEDVHQELIDYAMDFIRTTKNPKMLTCYFTNENHHLLIDTYINAVPIFLNPNNFLNVNEFVDEFHDFWCIVSRLRNQKMMEIIDENMEYIMEVIPYEGAPLLWSRLSPNPFAIPLIEKYPEYVDFERVLWNPNKEIIPFLMKNFGKINWDYFKQGWKIDEITGNVMLKRKNSFHMVPNIFPEWLIDFESEKSAIIPCHIYDSFIPLRNFKYLHENGCEHPVMKCHLNLQSFDFLKNNLELICFDDIVEKNYESYVIRALLYKLDQEEMKKQNAPFLEELSAYVFHPERISRFAEYYNIDFFQYIQSLE